MRHFFTLILAVLLMVSALSGCGCDNGGNADLVFVNGSDAAIVTVVADSESHQEGARNADNSPLKRGDSLSFEAGVYPVTMYVYDRSVMGIEENALARIEIDKAPPEGERWYVTALDWAGGIVLRVDTRWPEGV